MDRGNFFNWFRVWALYMCSWSQIPFIRWPFYPPARKFPRLIVTVGGGDKLHVLRVACYQSPDHINLLQGQLHGVQVLRAARRVG